MKEAFFLSVYGFGLYPTMYAIRRMLPMVEKHCVYVGPNSIAFVATICTLLWPLFWIYVMLSEGGSRK